MLRADIKETIGQYLSGLMDAELTHFLGRKPYERLRGEANHRKGSDERNFTLKGIGEVDLQVPRDRKGEFEPMSFRAANDTKTPFARIYVYCF